MASAPAALPPKKRQRGRPKKATAAFAAAAEAEMATATEGLPGTEPLTPLQKPKAPARKRAAAGGKRAAKGQTRAASTASAAVVPCSDEAPELVDVKQELPDVKVRITAYVRQQVVCEHRCKQLLPLCYPAPHLDQVCLRCWPRVETPLAAYCRSRRRCRRSRGRPSGRSTVIRWRRSRRTTSRESCQVLVLHPGQLAAWMALHSCWQHLHRSFVTVSCVMTHAG